MRSSVRHGPARRREASLDARDALLPGGRQRLHAGAGQPPAQARAGELQNVVGRAAVRGEDSVVWLLTEGGEEARRLGPGTTFETHAVTDAGTVEPQFCQTYWPATEEP